MADEGTIQFVIRLRGGSESAQQVRQVEQSVKGVGGTMKKVGDESERQGKRVGAFGSGLKKLAIGLGAVGAGFAAYNAAKGAIDYTTNLARSTESLSKATGMSTGQSSKLVAVAGALGVESSKLSQVFTKLGSATVKQAESTGKHITAFDRLGITQAEAKAHLNDTAGLLDLVTHRLVTEHIPGVEKAKLMTELFGRSWLPLGRLFLDGETNFKHLTALAKEYGLELGGNAATSVKKLKEQQEEYSLATAGLKVRFTELVAGPLGGVLQGFAKLTLYAKQGNWKAFNKEVEKIAGQFETLAEKVLPRVAESFAHIAPAVLKAFWRGFSKASLGGEALILGVLLTKFGLTSAIFKGVGARLGQSLGGGLASGAAKGEAASAGSVLGTAFGRAFAAVAIGYLAYENILKGDKNEPNPLEEAGQELGILPGYTKREKVGKALAAQEAADRKHLEGHLRHQEEVARRHTEGGIKHHGRIGEAERIGKLEGQRELERLQRPKAAMGARIMRSGVVEVGERGPELLHLPSGAQVTPLRPGSMADNRPIILKVNGRVLAEMERRELLQAQASGA